MRRKVMATVGAVVMTGVVSVLTASPAAAYSPGTATASRPVYNADDGGYRWGCSYAHWRSGAKVIWTCELHERYMDRGGELVDTIIVKKTGNWTPPPASKTTPKYLRKLNLGQGQLCTVARSLSVDGGVAGAMKCA